MKKIIVISVSILLISIIGFNEVNSNPIVNNRIPPIKNNFKTNESHVIQGVPIIGQDTRFYCTISSHTMILNYYGFNLTKYEVLYLMGGGFSLYYRPGRYLKPFSSVGIAFRPSNYEYVASLLNIEFQPFFVDLTLSEDIIWDKIWNCIKENVSLNQPVLVNLDSSILFAEHNGIKIPANIWKFIPIHADHAVTVVGYNESNQTICFNDPMYSILGDEKQGSYIWIDSDIFKASFSKFTQFSPFFSSTYRIKTYKKPVNINFDKEEIIEQVYQRNIQRLLGDYHYYISEIDYPDSYNITGNYSYGINASKDIKKIFGDDLNNQIFTISAYKLAGKLGIKNTFFTIMEQFFQKYYDKDISLVFDLAVPGYKNIYETIADEKLIISKILSNYSYLSSKYQLSSELLKNESDQWFKIAEYNRILLNKGIFITMPRAIIILNQMYNIMDNIIQIEQDILSLE